MKFWILFLTVYILINQGGEVAKTVYEGQSQETIEAMLKARGISYTVVDKRAFDLSPEPVKPPPDPTRTQALIDAKNASKTANERIDALIKVIDLR